MSLDDQVVNLIAEHEANTKLTWKNTGLNSLAHKAKQYHVTFRVQIKVRYGETICVMGSLPELGKWKEIKYHLVCKNGDYWESKTPLVTQSYYF